MSEVQMLRGKVLIPKYSAQFKQSMEKIPRSTASKALKMIAGFAGFDGYTFKQTKKIDVIPDLYRIQAGLSYRIMVKWKKDESISVLDIIPREYLRTWIKNYKRI